MKSYNTSIKVSLQHLTYWGILGKGVAVTPNVLKGLTLLFGYPAIFRFSTNDFST